MIKNHSQTSKIMRGNYGMIKQIKCLRNHRIFDVEKITTGTIYSKCKKCGDTYKVVISAGKISVTLHKDFNLPQGHQ